MKAANLRDQSIEELGQLEQDTQKELTDLRVKRAVGDDSEQPLKVRTLRRDLARIKTAIRERELKGHG